VIFYEPKNRGCAADFFLKGQDNSMVGGFIFFSFFFYISNVLFVWGVNPKGQVSGRGLWDISHIV
jgi:hypothetical protein